MATLTIIGSKSSFRIVGTRRALVAFAAHKLELLPGQYTIEPLKS